MASLTGKPWEKERVVDTDDKGTQTEECLLSHGLGFEAYDLRVSV